MSDIKTVTTTQFGEVTVDLSTIKRKKGLNSKIEGLIKNIKVDQGVSRLSSQEKTKLYVELVDQLTK